MRSLSKPTSPTSKFRNLALEQMDERVLLAGLTDSASPPVQVGDLTPQGFAIADLGVQDGNVNRGLASIPLGLHQADSIDAVFQIDDEAEFGPVVLEGFASSPVV
jgi:hypothetical protein